MIHNFISLSNPRLLDLVAEQTIYLKRQKWVQTSSKCVTNTCLRIPSGFDCCVFNKCCRKRIFTTFGPTLDLFQISGTAEANSRAKRGVLRVKPVRKRVKTV
uniref:Uncharacterized protein n=1 Tax=Eutreptiella gymnastica TaxID=73025 RepID=A0A7S1HVX7_9EUGL